MIPDDLISTGAAAKQLGVHPRTIRRWILIGRLRAFQFNKHYRISQQDITNLQAIATSH